jgi:hypothetical protein
VKCSLIKDSAITISDGLLVKQTTAVSESLWFSTPGADATKVPANPVKLINFATGSIAASGNTNFIDQSCDEKFIIQGTASELVVLYGQQDIKALSTFGNLVYTALNLFTGIASAFAGGPLAKAAISQATAGANTENPIKALITGANDNPNLNAVPFKLGTSSNSIVLKSPIGKVTITITPITDISDVIGKDHNFLYSFYNMINSLAVPTPGATGVAQCNAFDVNYIQNGYSFTPKDQAFILGYYGLRVSGGDRKTWLGCIASEAAAEYVLKFPYNVKFGAIDPITQIDIDNFWPNGDVPSIPVSLDPAVAKKYLNALIQAMSSYSQNALSDSSRQKLLAVVGNNKFAVTDVTASLWPQDTTVTAVEFLDALNAPNRKGYTRFGCFFYQPANGYDATFLALPDAPSVLGTAPEPANGNIPAKPAVPSSYNISDLLAIQIGLNANKNSLFKANIRVVQLNSDFTTISTTAANNGWSCGKTGTANINTPAKP